MSSDLRSKVIRLAHSKPELRAHLLPLLKQGAEWATEEARKQHLKDHPGANPSDHTVKKTEDKKPEGGESKGKAPKGRPDSLKGTKLKEMTNPSAPEGKDGWGDRKPDDVHAMGVSLFDRPEKKSAQNDSSLMLNFRHYSLKSPSELKKGLKESVKLMTPHEVERLATRMDEKLWEPDKMKRELHEKLKKEVGELEEENPGLSIGSQIDDLVDHLTKGTEMPEDSDILSHISKPKFDTEDYKAKAEQTHEWQGVLDELADEVGKHLKPKKK